MSKSGFNAVLFRWHKTHYRVMPWRISQALNSTGRLDPYRVLVSEIMLQQTGVDRVRGKYQEFLRRFPNVRALATASLGDVLRAWAGLGYNRRAKFLHECAKAIVAEHGGKFPRSMEELMRLPGVGRSTAAGIMAFAWNREEPMIDTNVRRVLVRTFLKYPHPSPPPSKGEGASPRKAQLGHLMSKKLPVDRELYTFAKAMIPRGKGRAWNYALLDLAATLCAARNHSDACPLLSLHGPVEDFVYKKPQSTFKDSRRYYRGRILHTLREAPEGLTLRELERAVPRSHYPIATLMGDLVREGLVVRARARFTLP